MKQHLTSHIDFYFIASQIAKVISYIKKIFIGVKRVGRCQLSNSLMCLGISGL
jgi:hypothetical protein